MLEATTAAYFKWNKAKYMLGVTEMIYIGDILSAEDVKHDKAKIKAIEVIPCTQSKEKVQCFFDMVNFLGKFILNLSAK